MDDWERLEQVGWLDESSLEIKDDSQTLHDKISNLEKEIERHAEHPKFEGSSETFVSDVNARLETLEEKCRDLEAKAHIAERKNSKLRESYEPTMEHERKTYDDYTLMLEDLKREKQDFEKYKENIRNEWQKEVDQRHKDFAKRSLEDMEWRRRRATSLEEAKEALENEKKKLENKRSVFEKERKAIELIKKQTDETCIKISTDLQALEGRSKAMKKEREEFDSEKRLVSALAEQVKGCRNCGDSAQALIRNNLRSVGEMSVLKKYATIIFKSPKDC